MSVSLQSSIRGCRVDAGWANRMQSSRFQSSSQLSCPAWNGVDASGRQVSPDTHNTKTAGCNSANDRIVVENALRPRYAEYVTLDAAGIRGESLSGNQSDIAERSQRLHQMTGVTGNFGTQFGAQVNPSCGTYPYGDGARSERAMARSVGQMNEGFKSHRMRRQSGM